MTEGNLALDVRNVRSQSSPPHDEHTPERSASPRTPEPFRRIVSVNPFRCRVWALHDRLGDYVTDESCKAEIDSFTKHGQLVPALGRVLRSDPEFDVEIIYGARRLFVAQHLNIQLQVELREMSDREAIIAMDIENRQRTDISPYERGLSYARWLRTKYFSSQDDIARALKISASQVSRLLKLAQLPSVVVSAFASPMDIREGWGLDVLEQWQDCDKRHLIAQRARTLSAMPVRISANEVYQHLITAAGTVKRAKRHSHDLVVKGVNGSPLFRVRQQRNTVAVLVPSSSLSPERLEQIREAVSTILQS